MDFSAFSDGQVKSKLWLCEQLEPYLHRDCKIVILGAWYNLLGFMLQIRKPNYYQFITGVDIDADVKDIGDKITTAWNCYPNRSLENITMDANHIDVSSYDCIISTSVEHMANLDWFDKISNKLVCIQSSDVVKNDEVWDIKSPNPTFDKFKSKFSLTKTYYEGQLYFDYGSLTYNRFMIIGQK